MKKILIAILTVAIREKAQCTVKAEFEGGMMSYMENIILKAPQPPSDLKFDLVDERNYTIGQLALRADETSIQVEQSKAGQFLLSVGAVKIEFAHSFQSDPFMVSETV
ncbi:hypothetical protein [Tellurirhabdus bombi]|uniref:hypothetical protein n=1 Tax=Tellurirhabdus bombi TaxID=2907205 RepID=UPI001F1BB25D|nr:hypothetical protein [Tellurirhabdus bombi]